MVRLLLRLIIVCTVFAAVTLASDIQDLCDSDDPTVKRICQHFLFNAGQNETVADPNGDDQKIVQTSLQSVQSHTQLIQVTPDKLIESSGAECVDPVDWITFEARINVSLSAHQEQINVQIDKSEQLTANAEDLTLRVIEMEQSLKILQERPECTCSSREPAPQRTPSSMKGEDFMESEVSVRQDLMKVQYDLQQASEKWQSSFQSKAKDLERSIGTIQSDLTAVIQQQEAKIDAQSNHMAQIKSQLLDQLSGIRHYFMKTVTDFYERMLERQNMMNQRLNTVTNELSAVKHRVRNSPKSSGSNGASSSIVAEPTPNDHD